MEDPEGGSGRAHGRENGGGEYRPPLVLSRELAAPDAIRDAVGGGAAPPAHLPTGHLPTGHTLSQVGPMGVDERERRQGGFLVGRIGWG